MNPASFKNLKPWAKGQSGNLGGRPKIPQELRGILSLNQLEVSKLISKYARMSLVEIKSFMQDPSNPVLDLAIAVLFHESIRLGDGARLSFLLDRAVGKSTAVMIEDDDESSEREKISRLSMHELLALVKDSLPQT